MIDQLRTQLAGALQQLDIEPDDMVLKRPKRAAHGDLASNAPLVYAKQAGRPPMQLAEALKERLTLDPKLIAKVDVAPPGFLNFTVADQFLRGQLLTALDQAGDYGKSGIGAGQRALVEFVSVNPTGPLTVGHGRGAILGDAVSNILAWNGYHVEREYYYNNAGRQMRLLGESVQARYRELLGLEASFPEDGYEGDYIREIAQALIAGNGVDQADADDSKPFTAAAERTIFEDIKSTLKQLGVTLDSYFNENRLYESGALENVLTKLREHQLAYEQDGATWLKATALGRADDRVLVKQTGEPTYRLPDIAYHAHKLDRGFDLIVDVFGADHQDTYPDVLAGLRGLGYDTTHIRVLIHQFVTLTQGGQTVKMSTRKATFVTLEELIQEVGPDVARYFFIMRTMDSHLQFDLQLARKSSDENPVYYLQYAHARMVNVAHHAAASGHVLDPGRAQLRLLTLPEERALMVTLWRFPEVVSQVLDSLEPQTVAAYLQELAADYHRYYAAGRVVTKDEALTAARLVLTAACRQTMANGLAILGVAAPDRL
ncbi:MAG: arginine--tRNA ligase [Candidatus Marinimicrobia bacterium]|nr:arginine--tRNA ligase [Candidatus Neomarinimicrobiota bacterium]